MSERKPKRERKGPATRRVNQWEWEERFRAASLSGGAKELGYLYATYCKAETGGEMRPGDDLLAKQLGFRRRGKEVAYSTVRRLRGELLAAGYLVVEKEASGPGLGDGGGNAMLVALTVPVEETASMDAHSFDADTPSIHAPSFNGKTEHVGVKDRASMHETPSVDARLPDQDPTTSTRPSTASRVFETGAANAGSTQGVDPVGEEQKINDETDLLDRVEEQVGGGLDGDEERAADGMLANGAALPAVVNKLAADRRRDQLQGWYSDKAEWWTVQEMAADLGISVEALRRDLKALDLTAHDEEVRP